MLHEVRVRGEKNEGATYPSNRVRIRSKVASSISPLTYRCRSISKADGCAGFASGIFGGKPASGSASN